ncbi:MAG: Xaa-Pro peptidase family protein [Elusimicrobiota bacterium]
MNLKIKKLQKKIATEKLDGFVSFEPSNIFYLTGFDAENSFVFVTRKNATLIVPELIYQSAKKNAGCPVEITKEDFFNRYKDKKIGFENSLSYKQVCKLKKAKIKLKDCSDFIEKMRVVKDKSELSKIKTACKISQKAMRFAEKKIKVGLTEKGLKDKLEYFLRRLGAEKSAFDIIVASSKNSANPHHKSTNRKFQKDDVILVDLGCVYDGYNSDLTRMFFLGKINKQQQKVFSIVKEAQQKAIGIIRDGVLCKKVDFTARDFIAKEGYKKFFIHGAGHGVGIDVHEKPVISAKSEAILKAGMVVTVEPGIYIPNKFGIRIENTVLVTKVGCEVLTK